MVLPSSHSPNGIQSVAGNEGGSVRQTVGVKLPWRQFAADRLATSLRLRTHLHFGVSRTNRDAPIITPDIRWSLDTELVLCTPDLKFFLVSGYYIGRIDLPKFQIGGQT